MPLSFEKGVTDLGVSTITLQDNISHKSLIQETVSELYSSHQENCPDNRLVHWKKCIHDRKRQHRVIEAKTCRKPADQCMNAAEDQRYIVEQRQILEFCRSPRAAHVEKMFDKCDTSAALCFGHPTLAERCIATPLSHVGVSTYICHEKDVKGQGDRKTTKERWLENPYLPRKLEDLTEAFQEINANEPEMNDLVIVGNNMLQSVQLSSMVVPVISVYQEDELREVNDSASSFSSQRVLATQPDDDSWPCLKINGRMVVWSPSPVNSSFHGSRFDGSDSMSDVDYTLIVHKLAFYSAGVAILKETIRVENVGNVKIRFSWHRKPTTDSLLGCDAINTPKFFFNKNSGVFLPGQVNDIAFWFYSTQRTGIFEEYWTLVTEPPMLVNGYETTVQLYAHTSSSSDDSRQENRKLSDIHLYLEKREHESCAAAIVDKIIDSSQRPLVSTVIYDFLFHRDEAFKDIGIDELYFGTELVERVKETFSARALDRMHAEHRVAHKELKKHDYAFGLLSTAVEKLEGHAEHLRRVFKIQSDSTVDQDEGDLGVVASTREVFSILKNEQSVRASLYRIAFSDAVETKSVVEWEEGEDEATKGPPQAYHDCMVAKMYADLCNTVEDISLAIDELDTPRSVKLFRRAPLDKTEVPKEMPFVLAPVEKEQKDMRLPRLQKIFDFEGKRRKPTPPRECPILKAMPVISYVVEQVPVEELGPEIRGKSDMKDKKDKKKGGSKGEAGKEKKGKKSKK